MLTSLAQPDNCLVDDTFGIKVADFGEARALASDSTMTQVGTPMFIAPEIVKGDHYGTACDVFSFAMTAAAFSVRGSR
jgi:Janus kinase 2